MNRVSEPEWRGLVDQAVVHTLEQEGVAEAEVSVTFLADPDMRVLNDRFLGHDWSTDVLSFPLHDSTGPPLGDVYIGVDRARAQAREAGISLDEEIVRLAVHGTLHVLGHEHPEPGDQRPGSAFYIRQEELVEQVMASREERP